MIDTRHVALVTLLTLPLAGGCTSLKRFMYEGPGRDRWQQPEKVVDALHIAPGSRIADIGAGGGYFTFRLADATGPQGKVYAVDVDPGMVDFLRERSRRDGYENVEALLAETDDPGLPDGEVDLVFLSNTYHHIGDRARYFANVRSDLGANGRVAVVEYQRKGWLQRLFAHSTESEVIRAEMEQAGYVLTEDFDFLGRQSFLVFTPAAQQEDR